MAHYSNILVTREFLDKNTNVYYVFPENIERTGCETSAFLRDHNRSIGFIAKKFADNDDGSFYRPEEYSTIFFEELLKLKRIIELHPENTYYIANMKVSCIDKFNIWNKLMMHNIVSRLSKFDNVVFCWDDKLI